MWRFEGDDAAYEAAAAEFGPADAALRERIATAALCAALRRQVRNDVSHTDWPLNNLSKRREPLLRSAPRCTASRSTTARALRAAVAAAAAAWRGCRR